MMKIVMKNIRMYVKEHDSEIEMKGCRRPGVLTLGFMMGIFSDSLLRQKKTIFVMLFLSLILHESEK